MPTSSTSTLSLAGRLRDLDDDDLVTLLTLREVRDSRVRDYFDLADALLDGPNIQRAFAGLDRMTLAALAAVPVDGAAADAIAAATTPLLSDAAAVESALLAAYALALVDRDGSVWLGYGPVLEQFATWTLLGLPGARTLGSDPAPAMLSPVSSTDARFIDHIAGEHAFDATNAVAALLAELQREPARELARGGIALPETKRLATAMSLELEDVAPIVDIASRAGLAEIEAGTWMPTELARDWLLESNSERWARLAGAWFLKLPADIRQLLASRARAVWGERLAEYIRWFYPAGGDWMRNRVLAFEREAETLGITANASPSTAGAELLTGGETAAATMAERFPAEIDKVYLQHDLTIVAPGPLLPRLDARLRTMANVETRALATTYRVSESTINRALTTGETAESIREFLAGISLTGIPQPLEYLIAGSAARFGSLRVGAVTETTSAPELRGALSYIRADDPAVLSEIMVDHQLVALGLTRIDLYRAVSRYDLSVVFWSLSEARYPVAAEDADGQIVLLDRARTARGTGITSETPAQTIVARLRLIAERNKDENDKAWLERQLDAAIRAKMGLTVTVAMPDGSSVDLQLEPASVAGGRLRARDRRSDLERTLPLSSITAVGPPE